MVPGLRLIAPSCRWLIPGAGCMEKQLELAFLNALRAAARSAFLTGSSGVY